jgi:hypothetical protein
MFYIFMFSMLFLNNTTTAQKAVFSELEIRYLGFRSDFYFSNFYILEFDITNKSQDTLYISKRNILIKVFNGKSVLKEKSDLSIGTPLILLRNTRQFKCEEKDNYEKVIEKLKLNFANKLFDKNFGSNSEYKGSKDFILENIIGDCIVLLPYESIDYSKGFYNEKFNKNCRVSSVFINKKTFSSFVNDYDKNVEINN